MSNDDDEPINWSRLLLLLPGCIALIVVATESFSLASAVAGALMWGSYAGFRVALRARALLSAGVARGAQRVERRRVLGLLEAARAQVPSRMTAAGLEIAAAPEGGVRLALALERDPGFDLSVILGEEMGAGSTFIGDADVALALLESSFSVPEPHRGDLIAIRSGVLSLESHRHRTAAEVIAAGERLVELAARIAIAPLDPPLDPARILADAAAHALVREGRRACLLRLIRRHAGLAATQAAIERALLAPDAQLRLIAAHASPDRGVEVFAALAASAEVEVELRLEAIDRLNARLDREALAAILDRVLASECPPEVQGHATALLRGVRRESGLAIVGGEDDRGALSIPASAGSGAMSKPEE